MRTAIKFCRIKCFRNWYVWNPRDNRYEDFGLYMYRPHYHGAFTRIPEDAMVLRTCKINWSCNPNQIKQTKLYFSNQLVTNITDIV